MHTFAEVVDVADSLTFDEKEELIDILKKRQIDARRMQIIKDIDSSGKELRKYKIKPKTVDEIMKELRS